VRGLFWIGVSAGCYALSLRDGFRADAEGLIHTDPPCARCARDVWEQRRINAMRRASEYYRKER
jgi:hypothetical protein